MNVVDRDTVMCLSLAARPGNHGNRFHNFLYAELRLNYLYKSFSSSDIGATIAGVRSLGIRGVSVSMPYKESCMAFLDALDPSAAAIDSVNTIVDDDGVLTGYNTDYLAVRALLADVDREPFALRGSGGMAKAVLAALVDAGFTDGFVVARNEVAGRALARRYGVTWLAEDDLGDLGDADAAAGQRHADRHGRRSRGARAGLPRRRRAGRADRAGRGVRPTATPRWSGLARELGVRG